MSKAFIRVCLFVILSVCLHDNSKTNDPKVFKLGNGLEIAYRWYDFGVKSSKVSIRVTKTY